MVGGSYRGSCFSSGHDAKIEIVEDKNNTHWLNQKISDIVSTILGIVIVIIVAVVSYNLGAIRGKPLIKLASGPYQVCQFDPVSKR